MLLCGLKISLKSCDKYPAIKDNTWYTESSTIKALLNEGSQFYFDVSQGLLVSLVLTLFAKIFEEKLRPTK